MKPQRQGILPEMEPVLAGHASQPARAGFPSAGFLVLLFWVAAAWPVLVWYGQRMTDGSDEPLGLLALATGAIMLWRERHHRGPWPWGLVIGGGLLLMTGVASLPSLIRATLVVLALAMAFGIHRRSPGLPALFLLALPWMASLDFFFGAPFRELIALGSAGMLAATGIPVSAAGAVLMSGQRMVAVDPPCTGLGMLWHALFLAAALAAWRRLGWRATVKLLALAVVLALAANIGRATLLFLPESGLVRWPAWTHEAVGIGCFVLAALPLVYLSDKWDRPGTRPAPPKTISSGGSRFSAISFGGWIAVCSAVVLMGLLSSSGNDRVDKGGVWLSGDWPETWDGHYLVALEPDAVEKKFAEGFPGQIRRFALPDGQLILRKVTTATRMLHPTSHCLRASGFRLLHEPVVIQGNDGGPCLRYQMTAPDGTVWEVTEYVRGPGSHSFRTASVTKWYWHALLHPGSGPWEAVTVMKRVG